VSSSAAGIVPVDRRAGLVPSFVPPSGATCLSEDARTYLGMAWPIRGARWILDHANLLRQSLEANR